MPTGPPGLQLSLQPVEKGQGWQGKREGVAAALVKLGPGAQLPTEARGLEFCCSFSSLEREKAVCWPSKLVACEKTRGLSRQEERGLLEEAGVGRVLVAVTAGSALEMRFSQLRKTRASRSSEAPLACSSGPRLRHDNQGCDSCVRPHALASHPGNGPEAERECVREHVQPWFRVAVYITDSVGGGVRAQRWKGRHSLVLFLSAGREEPAQMSLNITGICG